MYNFRKFFTRKGGGQIASPLSRKLLAFLIVASFATSATYVAGIPVANAAADQSSQLGQNLLTYSEQLDNAAWGATRITVAANTVSAPNGSFTADTLTDTVAVGTTFYVLQASAATLSSTRPVTRSVYAKAGTKTWIRIADSGNASGAYFNLGSGVVGNTDSGVTARMVPVGNGWYRCSVTYTGSTTGNRIFFSNANNEVYTGDGTGTVFLWGGQLVQDKTAGAYNRTVASAIGSTYTPTGASQSSQKGQNLLRASEQFDNASWGSIYKVDTTTTADVVAAPDGTMTADKIDFGATDAFFYQSMVPSVSASGTNVTFSVWLYSPSKATIGMRVVDGAPSPFRVVTLTPRWARYSLTWTSTVASFSDVGFENRVGTGGDGIAGTVYAWGAQLVRGSKPGAYNKTFASTVGSTYVPAGASQSSQKGQNLLTYSEQFDNASWNKTGGGTTINADSVAAPNGTMTADTINYTNVGDYIYKFAPTVGNSEMTNKSLWIRSATTTQSVSLLDAWTGSSGLTFNVTTQWTRITNAYVASGVGLTGLQLNALTPGEVFYIWGAQEVKGMKPGAYNRTGANAVNP